MSGPVLLLGACGMGMSPLALYLKGQGSVVYAYDDAPNPAVRRRLDHAGIIWTDAAAIPEGVETVVYSPAVAPEHILRLQAAQRGINQVARGFFLAHLVRSKRVIGIAGSHGKTTTTALLIHALKASGFSFSYVLGGLFRDEALPPAHYEPASDTIVLELDESDGSIAAFSPTILIILNLDWDHPGYYSSEAALDAIFQKVVQQTQGPLFITAGNDRLMRLAQHASGPVYTLGTQPGADYIALCQPEGMTQYMQLAGIFPQKHRLFLPLSGSFNGLNAVGALAAVSVLSTIEPCVFCDFLGVARRQDALLKTNKLEIWADYAHHPAEILAFMKAVQQPNWRTVLVFQPHRYTRTALYAKDFAKSLFSADAIILLPVYAASEPFLATGTSDVILEHLQSHPHAALFQLEDLRLFSQLKFLCQNEPTQLLFIGAGDIEGIAQSFASQVHPFAELSLAAETIFKQHEPLATKTTLRLGGAARFYTEPATLEDLQALVQTAIQNEIPWFVLGRGSNLLVLDEGYEGLVIRLNQPYFQRIENLGSGHVWAGAGARLKELCGQVAQWGLSGFEFLEGIPGSVGGALRMNAGAMGSWIFDTVESIQVLESNGVVHEITQANCRFGYRSCENLQQSIALGAKLKAKGFGSKDAILATMAAMATQRKASQPRESSAGCMFKNPPGDHAGRLVDEAGLKGLQQGAAKVSTVHGNFLVNTGGAKSKDMVALVAQIRKHINQTKHINLEPEVVILGSSWADMLAKFKL